jgi:hypothetical protein
MLKLLMLFFSLIPAISLFAQTTLSGKIGNMTIDGSGNPYIISDDITVPPGKTLNIGEGVILLFKPYTGLIIEGALAVAGSLEKPVIFTTVNNAKYNPESNQLSNPFDWNGIFITQKAELVTLSNFILEYSVYGVKSQKEEFVISNGIFIHNGQFHVTVNDAIKYVVDNIPFNYSKDLDEQTGSKKKSVHARKATNSTDNPAFKPTWRKPAGIGLGAVGLAAIGVGGYFFYLGNKYGSQYSSAGTQTQADDYFARKNSSLTTAVVCVISGAVSVVSGIALYPWNSETAKAKKVTIAPILGTRNGISIVFNY